MNWTRLDPWIGLALAAVALGVATGHIPLGKDPQQSKALAARFLWLLLVVALINVALSFWMFLSP
jgi:hypothetical protein